MMLNEENLAEDDFFTLPIPVFFLNKDERFPLEGLVDMGAKICLISENIVKKFHLIPVGKSKIGGVGKNEMQLYRYTFDIEFDDVKVQVLALECEQDILGEFDIILDNFISSLLL